MEGIQNERQQAKHVEMHRARRVPALYENKHPNEEIQQAHHAKVILYGSGFRRGRGNQRRLKLLAVARQLITNLRPDSRTPQPLRHLHRSRHGHIIERYQFIAGANSRARRGGIRRYLPRLHPLVRIQPRYAVIRCVKQPPLLEIQDGKRQRCHCRQRQYHRSETDTQILLHGQTNPTPLLHGVAANQCPMLGIFSK